MTFHLEDNTVTKTKGLARISVDFRIALEDDAADVLVTMAADERYLYYMQMDDEEFDRWINLLIGHRFRQKQRAATLAARRG